MSELTLSAFTELYLSTAPQSLPGFGKLHTVFSAEETVNRLYKITDKLIDNAKRFNLTSILEPSEIIRKHLIDSLIPLGLMYEYGIVSENRKKSLADVGTGAGFPCLPMAAASMNYFPLSFTGIDSTAKKIAHIKESALYAELDNIDAVAGRAEELAAGASREKYSIVTARAVAALPVLLELCAPLTAINGCFCALKSHTDEEIKSAGDAHEKLGLTLKEKIFYEIPGGDARALIIYQKTASTPRKFPRRYGEIVKHPLK